MEIVYNQSVQKVEVVKAKKDVQSYRIQKKKK